MNVYIISKKDKNENSYEKDYKIIVVAEDKAHAERLAKNQIWNWNFKKVKLSVTKVNLEKEAILSIENIN